MKTISTLAAPGIAAALNFLEMRAELESARNEGAKAGAAAAQTAGPYDRIEERRRAEFVVSFAEEALKRMADAAPEEPARTHAKSRVVQLLLDESVEAFARADTWPTDERSAPMANFARLWEREEAAKLLARLVSNCAAD